MRKILSTFLLIFCFGVTLFAQTRNINGVVISTSDKQPVTGCTVVVDGTTKGAISGVDGEFTLSNVSGAVTITANFLGFETQQISLDANQTEIRIELTEDHLAIDEVVVTAYGTQSKKAFTGTASIIKADQIKNLSVSSVSSALQGAASGVMVVSGSGQPGEDATIRVRGVGSLSGESAPLIVVDGVIYSADLNTINPNDIETFTVLKDANSTALYGSQAANGVIMITTKLGRPGKTQFSVNSKFGLSQRAVADYDYLNPQQYLETQWAKNYSLYQGNSSYTDAQAREAASKDVIGLLAYNPYDVATPIGTDGKLVAGANLLYQENWYDALFRVGKRQEHNFQALGGSETTRYLISGGYLSDEGMVKESKFDRVSARGKIDTELTPWLKAGLNMGLSYSNQNYPTQGGTSTRNSIQWVRNVASIYPAYVRGEDGQYVLDADGNQILDYGYATDWRAKRPVSEGSNPIGTFLYDDIGSSRFTSNNSGYLEASFLKHFTARTVLGVDYYTQNNNTFYNSFYGDGAAYGGISEKEIQTNSNVSWTNTLTYDKAFGQSNLNVLVGTESRDYSYGEVTAAKKNFGIQDPELDYGSVLDAASSWSTAARNFKAFARVNYSFKDRYHLSASFTRDGSSRFYRDSRWGNFWSVGGSWNINQEDFMSGTSSWLSSLKLRASYGTSGNQNLGYFPYLATYEVGWNMVSNPGSIVNSLANNNLTWEKQGMLDVGVDYAFLDYRITGSITYYEKNSFDLLMERPLPISAGITSYNDNVGSVKNNGVEFDVKGLVVQNNGFNLDLGLNLAFQKNRMTDLPAEVASGYNGDYYKRITIGESMYSWYLREYAGVNAATGAPMWYVDETDADGNVTGRTTTEVYSEGTRYIVGDALPKVTGGFSANFSWKGLYANALASFAMGNKILDTDYASLMHMFSSDRTGVQHSVDILDRWQQPGDISSIPAINSTDYSQISTAFLRKGDYLRLRNFTVGYDLATIPALKTAGLGALKVFFSADNLLTIFGTQGLDPEASIDGITDNNSTPMKIMSFGLSIEF
ncbi:MAG: SusC/RagA family TonB-linked outer membrane protein [Rikenellaceae bacterium]